MKKLVRVDSEIPWLATRGEGRLYITDELPQLDLCYTAFGFAFESERVLLTRLVDRDWDIPGGRIEPGETPAQAAIREVWEETYARVEITSLIGIQELELFGPRPENHRWGYPMTIQVYYACQIQALEPFLPNDETRARNFFAPEQARQIPTMHNHLALYEEALRRVTSAK
jgi:8-oxo-dGTP diphosphatase